MSTYRERRLARADKREERAEGNGRMITADQLRDVQARVDDARAASRDRQTLIRQALAEGWTQTKIAETLSISQSAVSQIAIGRRRATRGGAGPSA